jgi:hypothetical protein
MTAQERLDYISKLLIRGAKFGAWFILGSALYLHRYDIATFNMALLVYIKVSHD